jgi:kynurenine formamidase
MPAPHVPMHAEHFIINNGTTHPAVADYLALRIHASHLTHLDAVGHVHLAGRLYNGRRVSDSVGAAGLAAGSIEPAAMVGVFTRGVLLDLPAAFGVPWIDPGYRFGAEDLDTATACAGITIEPGDAVFVRCGNETRAAAEGPEDPGQRPGPAPQAVEWLHGHQIALYGSDAIEAHPGYPSRKYPLPLHMLAIPAMGLTLLDEPHLDTLAAVCREEDRYEFLFTVAPLRLPGGTGSPVNPLAVF